jgi:VanZ family protein
VARGLKQQLWLPLLIWGSLIFIGSTDILSAQQTSRFLFPFLRWLDPHISLAAINTIHTVIRKLGHVIEYAILAVLLWRSVGASQGFKAKTPNLFVTVWLACGIFAATDEFHQLFVPSRTAASSDMLIDICGATIGLAICLMVSRKHGSAAPINPD